MIKSVDSYPCIKFFRRDPREKVFLRCTGNTFTGDLTRCVTQCERDLERRGVRPPIACVGVTTVRVDPLIWLDQRSNNNKPNRRAVACRLAGRRKNAIVKWIQLSNSLAVLTVSKEAEDPYAVTTSERPSTAPVPTLGRARLQKAQWMATVPMRPPGTPEMSKSHQKRVNYDV